jgi:hypothetical protein
MKIKHVAVGKIKPPEKNGTHCQHPAKNRQVSFEKLKEERPNDVKLFFYGYGPEKHKEKEEMGAVVADVIIQGERKQVTSRRKMGYGSSRRFLPCNEDQRGQNKQKIEGPNPQDSSKIEVT